ncbi:YbgC/FadM family acyl-CoA thioesterase [Serratia sp. NPDC078593]|uniref:YbgC/FadM family acyl-CoA thioesterase n=1 Tax=unclassified Serratia (in: enterobacteria) TaxID=2647522 RepID=UPI0037CF6434
MRSTIRVYYGDTDAGGVVFHAAYVNFYDRARTEFFRSQGIICKELADMNCAFVVRTIGIEYLSPAFLDDLICINTYIFEKGKISLRIAQSISDQNGNIINQCDVLLVLVDLIKKKPTRIPFSMLKRLTLS